ncbi:MAG: YlxR family protein [Ilumatobacteraceae bacterium]
MGCRTVFPQRRLARCVLGPGGPVVDRTAPGRGAWLCSVRCLDEAIRRRAFDRAWRRSADRGSLEGLRAGLEAWCAESATSPGGPA